MIEFCQNDFWYQKGQQNFYKLCKSKNQHAWINTKNSNLLCSNRIYCVIKWLKVVWNERNRIKYNFIRKNISDCISWSLTYEIIFWEIFYLVILDNLHRLPIVNMYLKNLNIYHYILCLSKWNVHLRARYCVRLVRNFPLKPKP